MQPIQESLYVGQRLIATKLSIWHNQGEALLNHTAYFCPVCGEVWGRRVFLTTNLRFRAVERFCEQHGDGSLVSGELEWSYLLEECPTEQHTKAHEAHYPLNWLAYELFLIVRRS